MKIHEYPIPKIGDRVRFSSGNIAAIYNRNEKGFYVEYVDIKYPSLTSADIGEVLYGWDVLGGRMGVMELVDEDD